MTDRARKRVPPRLALAACALAALAAAPAAAQDATGKKHAVVIGINGTASPFAGIPTLTYAGKDADEVAKLLSNGGWDVAPITLREGTRARIVQELARLAHETTPLDTVLIYFAGHGVRDPGPGQHTYWVTYLVNPRDLPVEGIRLTHLLDYISEIPAARKLVILDHCYSGDVELLGAGAGEGGRDGEGGTRVVRKVFPVGDFNERVEDRKIPGGLVIFGAAREEAYEFADLGHGIFTWVLLDLLRDASTDADGNGKISITELAPRIRAKLAEVATTKPIRQVPIEVIRGSEISSWEPFDSQVDRAKALRDFLAALDLQAPIKQQVRGRCLLAINAWEQARRAGVAVNEKDQKIVDELNGLRDLGDGMDADTKRQLLELKVEAL
jgi:uncharacterized caspase-like protein